jgi:hypothetical protein
MPSSSDEYKVVADKIVSSDPDMIVSVAGGLYINSISAGDRVATINDVGENGIGPTGPTGPTGADGPTGPTGATPEPLRLETGPFTADHTLELADANKVVVMDGTTLTVFVPLNETVSFPIGTRVFVYNAGAATFTVAGVEGVTVRNATTVAQFQEIYLRKRGENEWVLQL